MSEKPEITRNDVAAIAFLKKVMDRLDADRAAYEERTQQFNAAVSALGLYFRQPQNLVQPPTQQSSPNNSAALQSQLYAAQYNAVAAQYGNQTPGHSHSVGGLGYSVPQWEPYLTQAEYETLKAWRDGDDILIHILSTER